MEQPVALALPRRPRQRLQQLLVQLRPQAAAPRREACPLSAWPPVDRTYILCRDDHAIAPAWSRRAARQRLGVEPIELDGGHSPFIESKSAEISAPADRLYGIIADYRNGHPRILPPAFTGLTVEAGGVGAGTRIRVGMRVFGRVMTFPAEITEPNPGRVLVERNLGERPSVTTFTVDPLEASRSRVTRA